MACYNNALALGSSVAKSNKERLIERGVSEEETLPPSTPTRESFESLKVEAGTIDVLQKLKGEAFGVTMYVQYGLPPYRWRLLYTSGVAEDVSLSPSEGGEVLDVSGMAAYINDPTSEGRLGWVMFEVTDSSQPTKWGKGGFAIHVNRTDQALTGEWIDDSPRYGFVISDGQGSRSSYWNYNVILKLVETEEQPNTFTGSMQATLQSITGPCSTNPDCEPSKSQIGQTTIFAVSGTRTDRTVNLYMADFDRSYHLSFEGDYLTGVTTVISDPLTWTFSFSLKRK